MVQKVAEYSLKYIPPEKLVMGLPFYGRSWGTKEKSIAYKHSSIAGILNDKKISRVEVEDNIPFFKYKEIIDVILYFENYDSIVHKAKMYYEFGINKLAFWRLGQEDFKIWDFLSSSLVQNNDVHRELSL
jgi:spore germination protein YaaH